MSKITNHEISTARAMMNLLDEGDKIPTRYHTIIENSGSNVAHIQHLIERLGKEGTLPEEKHRYQAKGMYEEWANGNETMPDEILNEFPTKDGMVLISEDEFRDILAYVADAYFG